MPREKNKTIRNRAKLKKIKNLSSKTFNDFRAKNLAMAIKATKLCGLNDNLIYKNLKKIKEVSGRMELIKNYPDNIKVFVDYAHTPDALFNTLKFLKNKFINNISLVFGCGGDRDKKKTNNGKNCK